MQLVKVLKATKCGDIFTNDIDKAKDEYRELVKKYHPDINKEDKAQEAFQIIQKLYAEAQRNFNNNTWEASNIIILKEKNSTKRRAIKFIVEKDIEIGKMLISSTVVTFILDSSKKKYYDNYIRSVRSLVYKTPEMREEFERYVPNIIDNFEEQTGKYVIVISKTPDVISLQDIIDYYNGSIPDRHLAWIISRLSNIECLLECNQLSHNGISASSLFISPQYHTVCVLGGWWYAVPYNTKMIGTEKQIYDLMTPKAKTDKLGSVVTDLESIKLLGRKSMGNTIPDKFKQWLETGSINSAVDSFTSWDKALRESYGERKFIVMDIDENTIYNK